MGKYLNIIHFCLYKFIYRLHLATERFNPANIIHKLPFQKRRYKELGLNFQESINTAWSDKHFGLGVTYAGGFLWGWMALLFFSLLMLFGVDISTVYVIGCAAISGIICYVFVFKNEKYIDYFDQYEKCSIAEKNKYGWLTAASVIAVFFLFYLGLTT